MFRTFYDDKDNSIEQPQSLEAFVQELQVDQFDPSLAQNLYERVAHSGLIPQEDSPFYPIDKVGWLQKQKGNDLLRSWKNRWYYIQGTSLFELKKPQVWTLLYF